jgi:hypothetical protein|tara:strand:+ start:746 stop:1600 length:855 start_codon:yes stop_codon:yes gene_type:complete
MANNSTDAERQAQADRELALKVKLEKPMERELNVLFSQIAEDLRIQYAATGAAISAYSYESQLDAIILTNNINTSRQFSDTISGVAVSDKTTDVAIAIAAIAAFRGISTEEHLLNIQNEVNSQSRVILRNEAIYSGREITGTIQKHIDSSIAKSQIDEDLDRGERAKKSSEDFKERSISHAATISATETQGAAEGTKDLERQVFMRENSALASTLAGVEVIKMRKWWITRGDSKVRPAHVAADGQEAVDGYFSVGGELLRYPKDPNGSAANVINCRCSEIDELF